jgi:metallopeptidase MepB
MAKSSSGWKIVREQLKDIFFSMFDMIIHSPTSHEELEAMNLAEVFNKLKTEIYSLPGGEAIGDGWEWGHGEAVCQLFLSRFGDFQLVDLFCSLRRFN